jgi:signal transduction histidine kinase
MLWDTPTSASAERVCIYRAGAKLCCRPATVATEGLQVRADMQPRRPPPSSSRVDLQARSPKRQPHTKPVLMKPGSVKQEQAYETRQTLAAAAHDLRGPVGAIFLFTELLEEDESGQLGPSQRELISNLRCSSEILLKLIDDLLDASVGGLSRSALCLQPLDLRSVAEESILLNRAFAQQNGICLELRCDAQHLEARLDRLKILRVINELLRNGIRFSNPNSDVVLRLGRRGRHIDITDEEEGRGIAPENFKILFSPFPKHHCARASGERGIGHV